MGDKFSNYNGIMNLSSAPSYGTHHECPMSVLAVSYRRGSLFIQHDQILSSSIYSIIIQVIFRRTSILNAKVGNIRHVVTAKSVHSEILSTITSKYGVTLHPADTNFFMDNWTMPTPCRFDLGVVVSFGYKIPARIINQFPLGMINVHPSLLPSYRGSSPIQSAIINRESKTGVSIIDVDPDVIDSGKILACQMTDIEPHDTFLTLRSRLADIGCRLLANSIADIDNARLNAVSQTLLAEKGRFARKLRKEDGFVDCIKMSAEEIYTVFRALYGFMTIHCQWKDKDLLLLEIQPSNKSLAISPGDIVYDKETDRLLIGCRFGSVLSSSRVQIATRKSLSPLSFAHGYHITQIR